MRRCAIGGFRPVESESELKNAKIGQLELAIKKNECQVPNFFGFLVITRTPGLGFGRNLVEIFPRSLPDLSKQPRALENNQKTKKNRKNDSKFF